MLLKRSSQDRGYADHGWLQSYHTFSFANYYNPNHMSFSSLRVINEDRIQGGGGFATHSHRDMEIITYVLEGQLEHKDSLGNGSVIERGKIQRMTAGTGIAHSEYNASQTEPVHLLQIWILPNQVGLTPSYEEKAIDLTPSQGQFQLIATPTGEQETITLHQDATLAVARLQAGQSLTQAFNPQRHGWLQVSQGQLALNGLDLEQGDGVAISEESSLVLTATRDCEVLLFDLP
ncbi:pirin family protein [Synechocystis sp. LKSZ1]|uniref:pirin family protein n=1 Tax=Synechocystis sp. LKSZ1 TaxID=3144951 RepID=UPI00336C2A7C